MGKYYYSRLVDGGVDVVIEKTKAALQTEGFGVLTEIDIQATMKKKLDEDIPGYVILGACNPQFAFKALQAENKIGTMLPCNVIVRADDSGQTEVAAVDPVASMMAIQNDALGGIASEVRERLRRAVDRIE